MTNLRAATLRTAIAAGKHVFTEKPTAETLAEAVELARLARDAGVTAGVVHDKLYLPGLVKLRRLVDEGFFGRILSLRGEFGYWVFEGDGQTAQRPSWNYRKEDGGGMTTDMFCHWNYVLENILGPGPLGHRDCGHPHPDPLGRAGQRLRRDRGRRLRTGSSSARRRPATRSSPRSTPPGRSGSTATSWSSSRSTAPTAPPSPGSTAASPSTAATPPSRSWNPDLPVTEPFRDQWLDVPANADLDNGFKLQWEEFLADVALGREHRYGLLSAARGVQLAELGLQSSAERRTLDIPEIVL